MTKSERDKIIEKVQAMLRLSADEGATEAEASLAMERAQELLLKHNLSMAEVEDVEENGESDVLREFLRTGRLRWKKDLLDSIAKTNFCRVLYGPSGCALIGRPINVEVVKAMHLWMLPQLEALALQSTLEAKERGEFSWRGDGLSWRTSFLAGAIRRIEERLREQRAAEEGQESNVRALVVHHEAENQAFLDEHYDKITTISGNTQGYFSSGGYQSGVQAGGSVSLSSKKEIEG